MKTLLPVLAIFLFFSCKQDEKSNILEKELTVAQKIANAHGYEN